MNLKYDWNLQELNGLYNQPFFNLLSQANRIHSTFHQPSEIQVCSLFSIKTGGCPEDCKYCAQSSRYQTFVSPEPLIDFDTIISKARQAIARGATRICLGAAWREIRDNKQFENVLKMVKEVTKMGVEVCCTLGMLNEHQAKKLKEANLYAYNHNLDTSARYYPSIISTRTYEDRLNTLDILAKVGISICCGGILGLGEEIADRLDLLLTLCNRNPHPESVPINSLSMISGTPLEHQKKVSIWDMVRIIAVARVIMPHSIIRLACGRNEMSYEEQALCFIAGANSLFIGEKLLTVANNDIDEDEKMFQLFGLQKRPAFKKP